MKISMHPKLLAQPSADRTSYDIPTTQPLLHGSAALAQIQQVYHPEDWYLREVQPGRWKTQCVFRIDRPFGIARELSYAPASTVTVLLSQISAAMLWGHLISSSADDPKATYQRLVDCEGVAVAKETTRYRKPLRLGIEYQAQLVVERLQHHRGSWFSEEVICVDGFLESRLLTVVVDDLGG
jgi:hypothetical protein